ncbi:MAG: DUF2004 domain-containing protein [Crocinitomicaceae bacterium]|nr:DUF2004 domain-containing protein [Crocinitomicaceae bacterium]
MKQFELQYFGKIDLESEDFYLLEDQEIDGHKLELDLTFEEESFSSFKLKRLKKNLGMLPDLIRKSQAILGTDLKLGDTVSDYAEHHLENFDDQELINLFGKYRNEISVEDFLERFKPVRVGFTPEDNDYYTIVDFSVNPELTQYLVAVTLNKRGKFYDISMES